LLDSQRGHFRPLNTGLPLLKGFGRVACEKLQFDGATKGTAQDGMDLTPRARREAARLAIAPAAFGQGGVAVLDMDRRQLDELQVAERGREVVSY